MITPEVVKARWVAAAMLLPLETRMAFLDAVTGGERVGAALERMDISFDAAMGIIEIHVEVLTIARREAL
jgi:hypothetical protein